MNKELKDKIIREALEQSDADCKSFSEDYDYTREEVNAVQKLYEPESFEKLAKLCEDLKLAEDLIDMVTYTSEYTKEEQEAYLINLQVFLEEPFYTQIEKLKQALTD